MTPACNGVLLLLLPLLCDPYFLPAYSHSSCPVACRHVGLADDCIS
jgi:hypothetical protein